jgi:hypothetical protein
MRLYLGFTEIPCLPKIEQKTKVTSGNNKSFLDIRESLFRKRSYNTIISGREL